jgi:hypothetical protein
MRATALVVAIALVCGSQLIAAPPRVPPDLTKGETTGVDRAGTYNLGATGLRGWMGWGCMNTSGRCRNVFLTPKG